MFPSVSLPLQMPQLVGQRELSPHPQRGAQLTHNSRNHERPRATPNDVSPSSRIILIHRLGAYITSTIFGLAGSFSSDKIGRRPALIYGSLGCCAVLVAAMAASSRTGVFTYQSGERATNFAAARAAVAFLIIFNAVNGLSYMTMLSVYPAEVLGMHHRSTGMALMTLVLNVCGE